MNIKVAAFTVSEKSINSEACIDIFHKISKMSTGQNFDEIDLFHSVCNKP